MPFVTPPLSSQLRIFLEETQEALVPLRRVWKGGKEVEVARTEHKIAMEELVGVNHNQYIHNRVFDHMASFRDHIQARHEETLDDEEESNPVRLHLVPAKMDFVGMGTSGCHTASLGQRYRRMGLERRRRGLGHSLAEVPYPHMVHLGVGSLGHSPDILLEGPRLMEDSAQRADEYVRQEVDESYVLLLYVFEEDL
jgi:hypothetical protein